MNYRHPQTSRRAPRAGSEGGRVDRLEDAQGIRRRSSPQQCLQHMGRPSARSSTTPTDRTKASPTTDRTPTPIDDRDASTHLDIRSHDRLRGILHEYQHAAWPARIRYSAGTVLGAGSITALARPVVGGEPQRLLLSRPVRKVRHRQAKVATFLDESRRSRSGRCAADSDYRTARAFLIPT